MRTTRKELESLLGIFIKRLNHPGRRFTLDYAACYGGYCVQEVLERGAVRNMFSNGRLKASEMETALLYAISAIEMTQE
jgi:hypothetical protein